MMKFRRSRSSGTYHVSRTTKEGAIDSGEVAYPDQDNEDGKE